MKTKHITLLLLVPVALYTLYFILRDSETPPTPQAEQSAGPVGEGDAGMIEKVENPSTPLKANRYTHQGPSFSFEYPSGFSVGSFKDDNGETVLVQDKAAGGARSFQIYITLQDEPIVVTKARIVQDAPDTVVDNAKEISIGGAKGLAFRSKNDAGASTREVWFMQGLYLYQVTGYEASEEVISSVVGTWRF